MTVCGSDIFQDFKQESVGVKMFCVASTVGEGVLIVLAWPKQLKHPHPQCLFVVNWDIDNRLDYLIVVCRELNLPGSNTHLDLPHIEIHIYCDVNNLVSRPFLYLPDRSLPLVQAFWVKKLANLDKIAKRIYFWSYLKLLAIGSH